uniref:Uncharacterized protein n=2 Tax=Oryza sativa subsp. japonica TaxID=39947 RepID=Q2R8E1_ORYSJ|nr:hypothetical protein LOC_Os11g12510 [Oryza sativa Japonica Group]ABA92182.1 hypothetical protein LOC_Os11g12510 [Oryza sativa Japonica Group]
MASDRTSSDDECSSNSKLDNKVADSDYANSISEEEETSDSDKNITKKDLVSTLKDLFSGSIKRKRGRTDKPVRRQKQKHTKLEYDQDKSGSAESPKPRSRLNITYFSNLIEGLSNEQRSIIEKSAFGSLLNFQRRFWKVTRARCIEQQGNNSNMSCSDALQQYHSKSFNPRLIDDISTACKWFTREHSDTTYEKNAQLAAKVLDCVYMSKASLFTQKDSTTTREEKSGEEKSKGGSKQGGSNVAHNGNAPPLEQKNQNNTDVYSQLPKTPQTKSTAEHKTKSNINNTSTSKGAPPTDKKASSKDFVCSQQSNNSVASRTRAKRLHSASPLSVVSISPSKKNSSDQKIRKAVRKQPLKATQPTSTQPDKEESNKDGIFVEPICTIPAKKEEVQPTKDLESNSTEFVIDIEGRYDVEDITGHTMDKTKFILVIYSNSSEDHKSQDPTQDESENIPHKSTNVSKHISCILKH